MNSSQLSIDSLSRWNAVNLTKLRALVSNELTRNSLDRNDYEHECDGRGGDPVTGVELRREDGNLVDALVVIDRELSGQPRKRSLGF